MGGRGSKGGLGTKNKGKGGDPSESWQTGWGSNTQGPSGFGAGSSSSSGGGGGGGGSSTGSKGTGSAGTGGVQTAGSGGGGSSSGGVNWPDPQNAPGTTVNQQPIPNLDPDGNPIPDGGEIIDGKLKFNQASKFRKWAHSIWKVFDADGKGVYTVIERKEYKLYSTNFGYQSINSALRKVKGDVDVLKGPNPPDISTDWQGKRWDYVYGQSVTKGNIEPVDMAQRVKRMDAAMDKAARVPQPIIVSRGTDFREFSSLGIDLSSTPEDFEKLVGKKYVNHGYTSTSLANTAAMSYKDVQLKITVPKGHKAINMAGGINHEDALSSLASENEFLLSRGTKFKIVKVERIGTSSQYRIEVEVIPGSGT